MSFIVLMRNPNSGLLLPLTVGEDQDIAEFQSVSEAREQADNCMAAQAWGYTVLDIEEGAV